MAISAAPSSKARARSISASTTLLPLDLGQQVLDPGPLLNGIVILEAQLRKRPQWNARRQGAAQEAARVLEAGQHFALAIRVNRGDVDRGITELAVDLGCAS